MAANHVFLNIWRSLGGFQSAPMPAVASSSSTIVGIRRDYHSISQPTGFCSPGKVARQRIGAIVHDPPSPGLPLGSGTRRFLSFAAK